MECRNLNWWGKKQLSCDFINHVDGHNIKAIGIIINLKFKTLEVIKFVSFYDGNDYATNTTFYNYNGAKLKR